MEGEVSRTPSRSIVDCLPVMALVDWQIILLAPPVNDAKECCIERGVSERSRFRVSSWVSRL